MSEGVAYVSSKYTELRSNIFFNTMADIILNTVLTCSSSRGVLQLAHQDVNLVSLLLESERKIFSCVYVALVGSLLSDKTIDEKRDFGSKNGQSGL